MIASAALLLALGAPAAAHEYPIKPVLVTLRVEPDRVVADVDSDSVYWIEEVVDLHPMPPRGWPADALAKAEKYVNARLRLSADGRPLAGTLLSAEYAQKPWEVYEQGRFRLRLAYPPVPDGAMLAGKADFFEEYRRERLEEHAPIPPAMEFRTRLEIPGRVRRVFDLTPESPSFSVPVADARRSAFQLLAESLGVGMSAVLGTAAGWAALAALALSLAPGAPPPGRAAAPLAAALAGAALPLPAPAWLPWAAGAAAALSAGRWLGAASVPWLEAAVAAALGRAWAAGAAPLLPRAVPTAGERAAAALGLLAAAAALAALAWAAVEAARRGLTALSQSRAPELFERRRRLAATVLLLACGAALAGSLAR